MKRSNKIMTGEILTGSVFLTACQQEKVESISFTDVPTCMQQKPLNEEYDVWEKVCQDSIASAQAEHKETAPRYNGSDLCEQEHGANQCQQVNTAGGGSFWMPFLMGYVVSSTLDSVTGQRNYNTNTSRPLYYSTKSKSYSTSTGAFRTSKAYGKSTVSKSALSKPSSTPKIQTPKTVRSTGGFGSSRSSSRSFGG